MAEHRLTADGAIGTTVVFVAQRECGVTQQREVALSTLTVTRSDGSTATMLSGGRGMDTTGDGIISPGEGGSAAFFPIRDRDRARQAAVDLMQLVRVIDTLPAVDASRIYYVRLGEIWLSSTARSQQPHSGEGNHRGVSG